jgi:site-specific DNA-methyltransferase (adenine-specific)
MRLSNIKDYKYDIYWQKERLTNIQQVKRRVGKDVETISVFYKKQCTYNPQMQEYYGKRRSNKIGNGKLGFLTDSKNKRPIEYIDNGKRYPTQVWKFKRDILKSNLHLTKKQISLLRELIKTFSNENDIILDNTMGSGSTIVASIRENRQYIGIEKDEKYFDIANRRIAAETSQLSFF